MDSLCKILIVDDEYLLRQGIKHLVDWKNSGFEIVGEALNGKDALDLTDILKPHIVITDIKMPVMDGVNLTKIIKEKYPRIQIVILSGYGDFDYVKETFKSGVNDYILKPKLDPIEFLSLLKSIASNIPNLIIQNTKNNNMLDINSELNKLISGFDQSSINTELFNVFPYDNFLLIGSNYKIISRKNFKNFPHIKNLLCKSINTYLKGFIWYELGEIKDTFLILINFENKNYSQIHKNIETMVSDISSEYPYIHFISSKSFNSLYKLEDIYNNNFKSLLGYNFFFKDKKIISYKDIPKKDSKKKFDFKYYTDQIYSLNISCALDYLRKNIYDSINCPAIDEFEIKTLIQNAFYNIINILDELHFNMEDMGRSKLQYFQKIDETDYAVELLDLLKNIEIEINKLIDINTHVVNNQIINKIIQYISSNYNEQLSLKEIADKFHFNYYYLSSYFSSHIQEGFSDYLNTIRVEKAMELLKNKNIPVAEISFMVGYSDHSYFCKVFKKIMKVTPSKFRKNIIINKRGLYKSND